MVTLKDISRATGISVTQISRALGGYDDVSPETRARVEKAAAALGYRVNAMARGLKTGRSGLIAIVLPENVDEPSREQMFEMLLGISAEISQQSLKLVLHVMQPADDVTEVYDTLYGGGGIDGFILTNPVRNDLRIAHLMDSRIPHVVHGQDPAHPHPFVDVDNRAVGHLMAEAALAQGHRRIAFLNGTAGEGYADRRQEGVRAALAAGGGTLVGTGHLYGPMTRARGAQAARALLSGPDRPTAILACNTKLARGVYDAAAALGLAIPRDLSVLAHDDGLSDLPADGFVPQLGGTRSTFKEAWSRLPALLEANFAQGPLGIGGVTLTPAFDGSASLGPVPAAD